MCATGLVMTASVNRTQTARSPSQPGDCSNDRLRPFCSHYRRSIPTDWFTSSRAGVLMCTRHNSNVRHCPWCIIEHCYAIRIKSLAYIFRAGLLNVWRIP